MIGKNERRTFLKHWPCWKRNAACPPITCWEKIKNAIVIAVKKDYEVEDENVSVVIEPDQGKFSVSLLKTVVEEVEDPATEISLEEAQQKKKSCKAGDEYAIPLKTKDFGRIAAQTAKHVIRQGLKEAERSQMYAEMQSKAR